MVFSRKKAQIEEALKREISKIVLYELSDPRIGFLSVTRVAIARDQRSAKVSLSIRGDTATTDSTLLTLRHARGHIQEKISKRLPLRFVPMLNFEVDREISKLHEIQRAVDRAHEGDEDLGGVDSSLEEI